MLRRILKRRPRVHRSRWLSELNNVMFGLLCLVVAPRRRALVSGWPDSEENALVMALGLVASGKRPVTFAAADPVAAAHYLEVVNGGPVEGRLAFVRLGTPSAFWEFLRSDRVYYTHGLYGSPRPRRRRVHVNLWHGNGPKVTASQDYEVRSRSSVVVGNTTTWGMTVGRDLGAGPERTLICGFPRQLVLLKPAGELAALEALGRLGIRRPFVLWMPTYRQPVSPTGSSPTDGREDPWSDSDLLRELRESCQESGLDFLVKAHPLDRGTFETLGVRCISDEQIWSAGISLYGLIRESAAIVSDYSSVWVDVLPIAKPVALMCPDYDDYRATRGLLEPELAKVASAIFLGGALTCDGFVRSATAEDPRSQDYVREVARALGATLSPTCTSDIEGFADAIESKGRL